MKKYLSYTFISLVAIFLILFLYRYFTSGNLTVTTSDPYATISISRPGQVKPLKQGTRSLSAGLHQGHYLVSVQGNSNGVSQTINIKAHHSLKLRLDPGTLIGAEPVINQGGSSLAADQNNLYFINYLNQNLYRLDGQSNLSAVNDKVALNSISWSNSSTGVGLDKDGNLYKIADNQLSRLSTPTTAVFLSAARNGDLYYSNGKTIYTEEAGGKFKSFYTAKKPFTSLAAFNNGVAVVNSPSADNPAISQAYISLIFKDGRSTAKNLELPGTLAWSPDSQYFAVVGSLSYKIYDRSLKLVAELPNVVISNPTWVDNNRLLYTAKSALWSFDLATSKSYLLANMPLGDPILNSAVSQAGDYVYLAVSDASGQLIKRVPLSGQKPPVYLFQLQSILPESLGECSAELINFVHIEIAVRSTNEGGNSPNCVQKVSDDLSQKGFDVSALGFKQIN